MTHVREHRSILAAAEKRLLIFIAERLPRSINSDHLTSLALAGMALAGRRSRRRAGIAVRSGSSSSRWRSTGLATASMEHWRAFDEWNDHATVSILITYSTLLGRRCCSAGSRARRS
jgi:hypothetical protein